MSCTHGRLQVRPYKTQVFSICDTCKTLHEVQELATGTVKESAGAELAAHRKYVMDARLTMMARAEYARGHTDEVLYINIDGMDQAKTNIPNELSKAKGDDVGMPLTAKLMGAVAYGHGWWGHWSFPEWAASSNVTLTALCRMFRDIAGRDPSNSEVPVCSAALPRRLHLQMDNTAKDNKNHYLLGFCGMLLAEGVFDEVRVFFLPVGHTHSEIDQTFSLVSKALLREGAYSLPDLMSVAQGAWNGHKQVGTDRKVNAQFDRVLDFRRLLPYGRRTQATDEAAEDEAAPRVHKFRGLGTERGNKR